MTTSSKNAVHDPIPLWPAVRYLFVLFAFALICDAISTILVMIRFGPGIEVHPVVRMVSNLTGPVAGPLLGAGLKAIGAVVITMYWRRFAACILSLASALYLAATCYNMWGIYGRALAP
jgi:hypothetical protein